MIFVCLIFVHCCWPFSFFTEPKKQLPRDAESRNRLPIFPQSFEALGLKFPEEILGDFIELPTDAELKEDGLLQAELLAGATVDGTGATADATQDNTPSGHGDDRYPEVRIPWFFSKLQLCFFAIAVLSSMRPTTEYIRLLRLLAPLFLLHDIDVNF